MKFLIKQRSINALRVVLFQNLGNGYYRNASVHILCTPVFCNLCWLSRFPLEASLGVLGYSYWLVLCVLHQTNWSNLRGWWPVVSPESIATSGWQVSCYWGHKFANFKTHQPANHNVPWLTFGLMISWEIVWPFTVQKQLGCSCAFA